MITYFKEDNTFYLNTKNTTYLFQVNAHKHLEHVYYGAKIEKIENIEQVKQKYEFELGSSTSYSKDDKGYMLNHLLLEVSTYGKGDYREPTIHIELPNNSRTTDFLYKNHEIIENLHFENLPQATKTETLKVVLEDINNIQLNLYFSVFFEEDVIIRNLEIINLNKEQIILDKALSMNLDMLNENYSLVKLDGAWIRERHISHHKLSKGTFKIDSKKGVSSSDHNPFLIIKEDKTQEDYGRAYGFALIYSGNFEANIEISPHDLLRVNMGINSFDFRFPLKPQESFVTPEVVLSFSDNGYNLLQTNLHSFINKYIIKKNSQYKTRPIVINNWEATYFDFNQRKLMAIAKQAKKLGIELFCLDDGWFGSRNDDTSSLGDWYYNAKKLPGGIRELSRKINKLGLDFGIWVEPEMINENSNLYKNHPDYAIKVPGQKPAVGRNQLIMDLTNKEVRKYIKNFLIDIIKSGNISYIKWDMNRNFSDIYGASLPKEDQGKFQHLYTLGLYEILEEITSLYPDIIFEGCASGGNRFDLGMLYYMPQIWTSDNTDSYERLLIQEGTSLAYPLSTISNHVSGDRSHQTFRHTPLESRFNVACFGVLGYELDLTILTKFEKKIIRNQIAFYKEHRDLFQFGNFIKLKSIYDNDIAIWMVINDDKSKAILGMFQKLAKPNPSQMKVRVSHLHKGKKYAIKGRVQYQNIRTFGSLINQALPIKLKVNHFLHNLVANRYLFKLDEFNQVLTGNQLDNLELPIHHQFTGTGYNDNVMLMTDFGSRLFLIENVN